MLVILSTSLLTTPPEGFPSSADLLAALPLLYRGFATLAVTVIVTFFVILGQAGMTGRAVLEGKTTIGDWGSSIKRNFFKVLGVGLIYVGILFAFMIVVGMMTFLSILPTIAENLQRLNQTLPAAPGAPQIPPSAFPQLISFAMVFPVLFALAQAIFYVLLAPAVMDNKGVGSSVDHGFRTIKRSFPLFIGYAALMCVVALATATLTFWPAFSAVFSGEVSAISGLSWQNITSQIIGAVFSPLYFLLAFSIYNYVRIAESRRETRTERGES